MWDNEVRLGGKPRHPFNPHIDYLSHDVIMGCMYVTNKKTL